jgi:hypothetical protein
MIAKRSLFMRRIDSIMLGKNMRERWIIESIRVPRRRFFHDLK